MSACMNEQETIVPTYRVGDRIVTPSYGLVSGRAKHYPYYQGAVYEVREYRSRPGRYYWGYVKHVYRARRSPRLAASDCHDYATTNGIKYIDGIRHGRQVIGIVNV